MKPTNGFPCPKCKSTSTHVSDSRGYHKAVNRRRRRYCEVCGERFSTVEILADEYDNWNGVIAKLRDAVMAVFDQNKGA